MIPREFIEELKYRSDLEEIVGSYVPLKRAGANLSGCCPFHSEKTPSFTVFPDKHFYCFGCGAGGRCDHLHHAAGESGLYRRSGISCARAGLTSAEGRRTAGRGRQARRVLQMNREAARYFRDMLYAEAGGEARAYLAQRQLNSATIRRFGLGFAPNDFGSLCRYLKEKGYTDEEMTEGFLCRRSDKNGRLSLYSATG